MSVSITLHWALLRCLAAVAASLAFVAPVRIAHAEAGDGSWAPAAPLPTPRDAPAAAVGPDGRVYVIGGSNNGATVTAVVAFDSTSNTWTDVAPLPEPRQNMAATVGSDGRIYVIGGRPCGPDDCPTEIYNVNQNAWTMGTPLPVSRAGLAVTTGANGRIYAIGGFSSSGTVAEVDSYDPASNRWDSVAPLPTARSGLAAATSSDGRIYVLGGTDPAALGAVSEVDAYTPTTNSWAIAPSLPDAAAGLAAVAAPDGRIYAFGALKKLQLLKMAAAYSPGSASWTRLPDMPTARGDSAVAAIGDRLYVLGGVAPTPAAPAPGGDTNAVDVFTPFCSFVLGFKLLESQIPMVVGSCNENEQHNLANGDGLQTTTGGLLVWRKADNFTAFTDGYRAWVNGPFGIGQRLNTERFRWEANPEGLPVVGG